VLHGAERVSIAVLVSAAIFQLATGLANAAEWYPWHFTFVRTHYAVGWVAIGALVVHVAVKLPLIRGALGSDLESSALDRPSNAATAGVLSRRGLLRTTWAATGVAVLATAGSTVPWLRQVSVLAVRSGDGPQQVPVRTSAATARVTAAAVGAAYRLTVTYDGRDHVFTRAELEALPQTSASLPIACVEGWSAGATWRGVRVRDLLDRVGAPRGRDVEVFSLQQRGPFRTTRLPDRYVDDPLTLLALELNGETLSIDHGYPARVIAPDRPGELQTKWVTRLEVLS
jgi:DMSO/TMAO reductase YedYZ molybdopterin-dependent catalytic subunit